MTHGVPLSECPVSTETVQLGEDEYLAPRPAPAPAPAPDLVRTLGLDPEPDTDPSGYLVPSSPVKLHYTKC